jgi:hypothetical protein
VVTIRDGSTSSETVRRVADVEAALAQGASSSAAVYEEFVVVDGAGRLQIPPDLRAELDIVDRVTLERADGGILIRPAAGAGAVASTASQSSDAAEDDQLPSSRTRLQGWLQRVRRSA